MRWRRRIHAMAVFTAAMVWVQHALAGIPFISDDPVTVPYGHWELYFYSAVDHTHYVTLLQAPAIETDIGVVHDVEFHLVLPYNFYLPQQGPQTAGFGDMELGIKYRFLNSSNHHIDVAFAPLFEMPTGDQGRNLGNGRYWTQLPLWLEKKWGAWSSYGGGGYAINPAPAMRNYPFAGWVVQRVLNKHLTLGSELYWQRALRSHGEGFTIFDAGGYYYFNPHTGLVFSAGQSINGERHVIGTLGLFWMG